MAMAAWITKTSNALSAPNGNPAGLMARRLLALTADRLGCEGISLLEWMPWHLADDLREDMLFEAWYLMRLCTGTKFKRTQQPTHDGPEDDKWKLTPTEERNRGPRLWEPSLTGAWLQTKPCHYRRRLAELRIRRWPDVSHTDRESPIWLSWTEAKARYPELESKADRADYEVLIDELTSPTTYALSDWWKREIPETDKKPHTTYPT
jgi:hypothetical protein